MKTKIITDSGSGISRKEAEKLGVELLPLQVLVDDTPYLDGVDLQPETLFDALREGKFPTTSQPPLLLEEEMFERLKNEGVTDLILINLSPGLSSTNEVARATAKRMGLNVHTLDLYTTLMVQNYAVKAAKQLLDKGESPEEIIEKLKKAVEKANGYLVVSDLEHLANGGRLTPMAAKLGGMLKIKPIMKVGIETNGKVDVFEKVRTYNKAVKRAFEQIASEIDPDTEYEYFVMSSDNTEAEELVENGLKELLGENISVHHDHLYPVIACHTGLGAVGVQYIPKIEGVEIA
jgi:DegV family protein with EDD domain